MIKHVLIIAVFLLTWTALSAQFPGNASFEGRLYPRTLDMRSSCFNYAGTLHFGLFNGQSNTVGEKLIYLCASDSLEVIHNGDFNLSGDPDPFSPAGIRYAFYDCQPTVTGSRLSDILGDRCLNKTNPIFVNGQPVPQTNGLWITTGGTPGGHTKLFNAGQLQSSFANGKPVAFWFAPITIDDWAKSKYELDSNTGETGSCVHVNTDAAFKVVYLNPIAARQVTTNIDGNGCQASFIADGGLPEYDNTTRYSVRIHLQGNPSIQGYLQGNTRPGYLDTVRFFVPQPGTYEVIVEDGKSCEASFVVDLQGCDAVSFHLPYLNKLPGDTVCMPVTATGFTGVGVMELDISWDTSVLHYIKLADINPSLTGFNTANVNLTPNKSQLNIQWLDAALGGVSVPSGDTLFSLCFTVSGQLGDKSPVRFSPAMIPSETIGTPVPTPLGFIFNSGQVNVSTARMFFDVVVDSVSCNKMNDGQLLVIVAGGEAPYEVTYRRITPSTPLLSGTDVISGSSGQLAFNNLEAGQYVVWVRDAATPRNEAVDTVTIHEPPTLAVVLVETNPGCFGSSDGALQAEIVISGTVQPNPGVEYVFRWSIPGETGDRVANLKEGPYAVTVTDRAGCSSTASTNLSAPAPILLQPNLTDATCSGVADGGIALTATGGSPNTPGVYTFVWEGKDTVHTASFSKSGLTAGVYCVSVIDDKGCRSDQCFTIGAKKTLALSPQVVDALCNGQCNGEIQVTGMTIPSNKSNLPYSFTWDRQGSTAPVNTSFGSTLKNLCAGQYIVRMVDSDPAGCSVTDTIMVKEPDPIEITKIELVNETCIVGSDGRIVVGVRGGTYPYAYVWNNGQTDSIALGLRAGVYTLQATDARKCSATFKETILAPTPPQILQLDNDTLSCALSTDGRLQVVAQAGGAAIVSYSWSNGTTGTSTTGLVPGTYTVTILANDGCRTQGTARVVAPEPLRIDSISITSPRCPGEANGNAVVHPGGGTTPYKYIWAGSARQDTSVFPLRPGLSAGTYSVTVSDVNGCPGISQSVVVMDPPRLEVLYSDLDGVSCFAGVCDGSITATGRYSDGGTGLFRFSWSSGEESTNTLSSHASKLCGGANVLVMVDGKACVFTDTILIPSPDEINISFDVTPISCNAGRDGQIMAQVQGGTPGYSYLWVEQGVGTNRLSGLGTGTYTLRVSDNNACVKELAYQMTQPDQLILTVDPEYTNNARCFGASDGRIKVVVNTQDSINPLPATPYTWSGNIAAPASSRAENLSAGNYSVTVTDSKGCQAILEYAILEPDPLVATIPVPEEPRCFGESTLLRIDTIYGGNGSDLLDYTFSVNNTGLSFSPNQAATVFSGELIVTVEDPLGCTYSDTLLVTEPEELRVVFDPATIVVELGDTLTALNPIITGTTPVDSFIWSPINHLTAANIRNPYIYNLLEDQNFKLTVIDINGCKASGEVFVELDRNRNIYIPNVFSPNGDGWNDELRVFACKGVTKINYALVFDRWGGKVFESRNVPIDCLSGAPLWDGRVDGKLVPPGVYVYMVEVEFLDGVVLLYRGDTTVFR